MNQTSYTRFGTVVGCGVYYAFWSLEQISPYVHELWKTEVQQRDVPLKMYVGVADVEIIIVNVAHIDFQHI